MREIVVIAHDIRSSHNVGSLMRTCEGVGIRHLYVTGLSPYPSLSEDERLPHIHQKLSRQINKTALNAEETLEWSHHEEITTLLGELKESGFTVVGLEQDKKAIPLPNFEPSEKIAILLGREVEGIEKNLLDRCDSLVEIPMFGQKESFNVVQASAMILYHCRFWPFLAQ